MIEIQAIEGGQKNMSSKRSANIKKVPPAKIPANIMASFGAEKPAKN